MARADGRAQRFVDADGLAQLLAHQLVAAGEFVVVGERLLDAGGVAAAQRAGSMPRQEELDVLLALLCASCSWPTSFNSLSF